MTDQIIAHVEYLFQSAPRTAKAVELKEELIANLCARYTDLVQSGESAESAFSTVIGSIGDVDELLRPLRELHNATFADNLPQRQKSALLISGAVGLSIFGLIFPLVFDYLGFEVLGMALLLICWAAAASLLVYDFMTKPKRVQPTPTPSTSQPTQERKSHADSYKLFCSVVYTGVVPLYLCLGIFFDAWHPGWLVFVLAPVVCQFLRFLTVFKQDR